MIPVARPSVHRHNRQGPWLGIPSCATLGLQEGLDAACGRAEALARPAGSADRRLLIRITKLKYYPPAWRLHGGAGGKARAAMIFVGGWQEVALETTQKVIAAQWTRYFAPPITLTSFNRMLPLTGDIFVRFSDCRCVSI